MDYIPDEVSLDIADALENLTRRVEALERELAALKGEPARAEAADEPIDLSLEDPFEAEAPSAVEAQEPEPAFEPEITADDAPAFEPEVPVEEAPASEPKPAPEPEPVKEEALPEPPAPAGSAPSKDQSALAEDLPAGLFGFAAEPPSPQPKGRRKRILNDVERPSGSKAVMDVLADGAAWRHDIPGPQVKSLRSAIGLGDQVLFIRRLFRDDSALYQSSIDKLNSMTTLAQAIEFLSDTFPEWDVASDDVYRFMMAVRRKIRK